MISRRRMKFDLLGQSVLIVALILMYLMKVQKGWTNLSITLLYIWQFASAIHLFYAYQYVKRQNYLLTALILAVSLPIWIKFVGNWAFAAVIGLVLWYFFQSIKDTIVVYRRPRSFWDL